MITVVKKLKEFFRSKKIFENAHFLKIIHKLISLFTPTWKCIVVGVEVVVRLHILREFLLL